MFDWVGEERRWMEDGFCLKEKQHEGLQRVVARGKIANDVCTQIICHGRMFSTELISLNASEIWL